jgi:hypothetical protein
MKLPLWGWLAIGGGLLIGPFVWCGGGIAIGWLLHRSQVTAAGDTKKADYPYPECEAIMAWLWQNVSDPASLEVISWKKSPVKRYRLDIDGGVYVRCRMRTPLGGMGVNEWQFVVEDNQVVWHKQIQP